MKKEKKLKEVKQTKKITKAKTLKKSSKPKKQVKMTKAEKIDIATKVLFIVLELAIFAGVFWGTGDLYKLSCFAAVVNPFAYSLKFLSKNRVAIFTQIALGLSVFAELFLSLITPNFTLVCIVILALVQLFYAIRLISQTKKKIVHIVIRVLLCIASVVVPLLINKEDCNYLNLIAAFALVNLVVNWIYSMFLIKKSPLFALGLFLLVLGGFVVCVNNLVGTLLIVPQTSVWYNITQLPFNVARLSYIPANAFIAYGLQNNNK